MTATNGAGAAGAVSASEQSRPPAPRLCGCGATLGERNRSGACRTCRARLLNGDPTIVERRAASLRARYSTDEKVRERHRQGLLVAAARRKAAAAKAAEEATAAKSASAEQTADDWCPPEHRPLNAKMKRQGFAQAERREIILADVPGTVEHARRTVRNHQDAQRIRAEREKAQAY